MQTIAVYIQSNSITLYCPMLRADLGYCLSRVAPEPGMIVMATFTIPDNGYGVSYLPPFKDRVGVGYLVIYMAVPTGMVLSLRVTEKHLQKRYSVRLMVRRVATGKHHSCPVSTGCLQEFQEVLF